MAATGWSAMTISDDILSAYLDGELEPAEAERVRTLVERDAGLVERLARLEQAGVLTREAFAPLMASPAPHALRVASGERFDWKRIVARSATALAACAAGIVLGVSLRGEGAGRLFALDRGMLAAPALASGLDTTMSGASSVRGGVAVTPVYSFRDVDGRACRVFRSEAGATVLEGAACREGGAWRIEALAPAVAVEGRFSQASGDEPAAVAGAMDRLWADEIAAEEEARLIAQGWR